MKRVKGTEGIALFECINPALNKWSVRWDMRLDNDSENEDAVTYMEETFTFQPDLSDVQDVLTLWCESEEVQARFILDGQTIRMNEQALLFLHKQAEQAEKEGDDTVLVITSEGVREIHPKEAVYIVGNMLRFLGEWNRNTLAIISKIQNAATIDELVYADYEDGYPDVTSMTIDEVRAAISSAKKTPEQQAVIFAKMSINTLQLDNKDALSVIDLHPSWESFIGMPLNAGFRVLYDGRLYRVRQTIPEVLSDQAPSIDTAALYEEICEEHTGTADDPIPYNNNMELFNGKYYIQKDVRYLCTRDSGQPLYNDLSALVGLYVEVV